MSELGIHGHAYYFHIAFAELFYPMRVGDNFRGADEGEIQRIEKQYSIFARNFGMKIESIIETAIRQDGRLGEVWCKMGYKY